MSRKILLDAGVLGLACSLPNAQEAAEFDRWIVAMVTARTTDLIVPELNWYEVRRELIRLRASTKLHRLDDFVDPIAFAPVTREAWARAAEFWALVRQQGRPTADPEALDADAILAGGSPPSAGPAARSSSPPPTSATRADSPGIDARRWQEIA